MSSVAVVLFAGCSGSGGADSPNPSLACHAEARLTFAGTSNGSAPVSGGLPSTSASTSASGFVDPGGGDYADATYLYFSTDQFVALNSTTDLLVSGVPILTGSDGSTIDAGQLAPVQSEHDDVAVLFGYSASISGLKTSTTYSIAFKSLEEVQTGCVHGPENAGSFSTSSALVPPNIAQLH